MFKKIDVGPNQIGFVYKKNSMHKKLMPGIYKIFDPSKIYKIYLLPTISKVINIVNQEVITKDNISLRFSFIIEYKIIDFEKVLNNIDLTDQNSVMLKIDEIVHLNSQVIIRKHISKVLSEDLNENRDSLFNGIDKLLNNDLVKYGVNVEKIEPKDILFPKNIQDVFLKHLEAKIRAKSDLENARTQVASARALKNASDLIKNDSNIKYIQWLEVITKIASKGNHTFYLGNMPEEVNLKKKK